MKTMKGKMVGVVFRIRKGRCQYNAGTIDMKALCGASTRMGIGFPAIDTEGLIGIRVCGQHLEDVVAKIAGVK